MAKKKRKTVIITGGNKGIGAAIARIFYNEGYFVVIGARTVNGITKKLGKRSTFIKMNVTKRDDHQLLVKTAYALTGALDVYVNCAGFSEWKMLGDIDEKFCNSMIDTNLKGVLWGSQAAAKRMKKGSAIINISSLASKRGSAHNTVYCATKFGVNGITQSLAKELGPKGIRVNAVCPVYVKTKGLLKALNHGQSPAKGKNISNYLKLFGISQSALQCLPTAVEVAYFCYYLASSKASAITGQCINIDCGVLPQ